MRSEQATDEQQARHQALFAESARLGVLLGALEIPWTTVAPIVAAFPSEVAAYTEFSVSDSDGTLGIMVRGEGVDFTHRVAHFMEERGVQEPRLRRFLATARQFEHKNLFFKVEADPTGVTELSWYIRRRPPVQVAIEWLRADGIDDAPRVERVARLLGKNTVHFIAQSEHMDGSPTQTKLYFSQPDSTDSWSRLQALAGLLQVGAEWGVLEANASGLQSRFTFASIGWRGAERISGFKLDVRELTGVSLGRIVRGAPREAIERIHLLLSLHDKEHVDYAGFRLSPGQRLTTKVYAAR